MPDPRVPKQASVPTPPLSLSRKIVISVILLLLVITAFTSGSSLMSQFFSSDLSKSASDVVPQVLSTQPAEQSAPAK